MGRGNEVRSCSEGTGVTRAPAWLLDVLGSDVDPVKTDHLVSGRLKTKNQFVEQHLNECRKTESESYYISWHRLKMVKLIDTQN